MKKIILIFALVMINITSFGQNYQLTNGAYDNKIVGQYAGVDASTLYVKSLETLSDWSGSQKQSKINIDVQDKEQGLIVYKGSLYIGYYSVTKNFLVAVGWNIYADFTLKIKCKDGKAQVSCHVPTLTFDWSADNDPAEETIEFGKLYPQYNYKSPYRKIKQASIEYAPKIPPMFDNIITNLVNNLNKQSEYDF